MHRRVEKSDERSGQPVSAHQIRAGACTGPGVYKAFLWKSSIRSDNSDGWKGQNTISVYGEGNGQEEIAIHAEEQVTLHVSEQFIMHSLSGGPIVSSKGNVIMQGTEVIVD